MALLPKVLAEDDVDAVHDLRVWSRRLQQVVSTLSADAMSPEARAMVRVLRRARRALGGWRDCDVLIDLLERKARRVRNPEEKEAYAMIRELALAKRDREIRRARRKLARRKLFALAPRAQRLLEELSQGEARDAAAIMASSVSEAYAAWREALGRACESFEPADVHAFRIRTKRLRYRVELVRDLGERDAEGALDPLRSLQDVLGAWHDRVELLRLTAEALADSEFLLRRTALVVRLLRKSDREQLAQRKRIRRLLAETSANLSGSALDDWVARYCRAKRKNRREESTAPEHRERKPHEARQSAGGHNGSAIAQDNGATSAPAAAETPVGATVPFKDFVEAIGGLRR